MVVVALGGVVDQMGDLEGVVDQILFKEGSDQN